MANDTTDTSDTNDTKEAAQISPYVFTILLAGFGLWCFYDGWLSTNPEMQEHALLNQIVSAVLLPWAAITAVIPALTESSQIG